jgi:hypothetical protein
MLAVHLFLKLVVQVNDALGELHFHVAVGDTAGAVIVV